MKLTTRDKHILRSMLSDACAFDESTRTGARIQVYEKILAKVVPLGRLPKLRKVLWK